MDEVNDVLVRVATGFGTMDEPTGCQTENKLVGPQDVARA